MLSNSNANFKNTFKSHCTYINLAYGSVVDGEKDVSLFLDETSEPAAQQRDSSRLKNKDTSYSPSTTDPKNVVNCSKLWF